MKFVHDQQCAEVTKGKDCSCGLNDYEKLLQIHAQLYSGGAEREAVLDLLEFLMEKVGEYERIRRSTEEV